MFWAELRFVIVIKMITKRQMHPTNHHMEIYKKCVLTVIEITFWEPHYFETLLFFGIYYSTMKRQKVTWNNDTLNFQLALGSAIILFYLLAFNGDFLW